MCIPPELILGQNSCYLINCLSHVIWFSLTLFRLSYLCLIVFRVYFSILAMFGLFDSLSLCVWFNCYLFLFSICLIVVLMYFLFSYYVIFNMLFVSFYLSAWCMFRLKIMTILITSLFKYGLTTHNGGRPMSRVVLGA